MNIEKINISLMKALTYIQEASAEDLRAFVSGDDEVLGEELTDLESAIGAIAEEIAGEDGLSGDMIDVVTEHIAELAAKHLKVDGEGEVTEEQIAAWMTESNEQLVEAVKVQLKAA